MWKDLTQCLMHKRHLGISVLFSFPSPPAFNNLEYFSGIGWNLQTSSTRATWYGATCEIRIVTSSEYGKLIFDELNLIKINKKTKDKNKHPELIKYSREEHTHNSNYCSKHVPSHCAICFWTVIFSKTFKLLLAKNTLLFKLLRIFLFRWQFIWGIAFDNANGKYHHSHLQMRHKSIRSCDLL